MARIEKATGFGAAILGCVGLGMALSSFSCAGAPERATGTSPIIIVPFEGESGSSHDTERNARLRELLDRADAAFRAGKLRESLALLSEVADADPPSDLRGRMVQLRMQVKKALLSDVILEGELGADAESFELGETVRITASLKNRGSDLLGIPLNHSSSSPSSRVAESNSRIIFRIFYQEWDRSGTRFEQSDVFGVELERGIEIVPGGSWERVIPFPTDVSMFRPQRVVYRRVTISATLQPVEIVSGDLQWFDTIDFTPVTFEILPPGIEPVLADPATILDKAVIESEKGPAALNHVFFSSIILYRQDARGAVERLVGALSTSNQLLRQTAQASLRFLSGRSDVTEAEEWRRWMEDQIR